MESKKLIGIISSILLIINYIGNSIIGFVFIDKIQIIEFYDTIGRLILSVGMIGFYYSLSKYLKQYGYNTETKILISIIILVFIILTLNVIQYFYGLLPRFIMSVFYFATVILLFVVGVRILMLRDELFMNLKNLKTFIIALFIGFGLGFISNFIFTLTPQVELINGARLLFAIPYIFGLIYFLKNQEKKNNQQLTASISHSRVAVINEKNSKFECNIN